MDVCTCCWTFQVLRTSQSCMKLSNIDFHPHAVFRLYIDSTMETRTGERKLPNVESRSRVHTPQSEVVISECLTMWNTIVEI